MAIKKEVAKKMKVKSLSKDRHIRFEGVHPVRSEHERMKGDLEYYMKKHANDKLK